MSRKHFVLHSIPWVILTLPFFFFALLIQFIGRALQDLALLIVFLILKFAPTLPNRGEP